MLRQLCFWCNCLAGDKGVGDGGMVSMTARASVLQEPVPNPAMLMIQIRQGLCQVCVFWTEELGVFLGKIFLYQQRNERFGLPCPENKETKLHLRWSHPSYCISPVKSGERNPSHWEFDLELLLSLNLYTFFSQRGWKVS